MMDTLVSQKSVSSETDPESGKVCGVGAKCVPYYLCSNPVVKRIPGPPGLVDHREESPPSVCDNYFEECCYSP